MGGIQGCFRRREKAGEEDAEAELRRIEEAGRQGGEGGVGDGREVETTPVVNGNHGTM